MAVGAGKQLRFYGCDITGETHLIRVDDVTVGLNDGGTENLGVTGPATNNFWAKVSRGATEYGLKPRTANVCITGDPGTTGLEQGRTYDVPILDSALYAALTINKEVLYQGVIAKVVGKTPESIYPGI